VLEPFVDGIKELVSEGDGSSILVVVDFATVVHFVVAHLVGLPGRADGGAGEDGIAVDED
jgi:hypothetical protein